MLQVGTQDGTPVRKYLYGATQKAVRQKLKQAQQQLEAGLDLSMPAQTVAQFLDRWLSEKVQQRNAPSTYHSYAQMMRLHVRPALGHLKLADVSAAALQQHFNRLHLDGLSPRTVQYVRTILRTALNQAIKWGLLSRNPAELVDTPRVTPYQPVILPVEQAQSLLSAVKGHRLEALYRVALGLGLRQGEIIAFAWADIDFAAQTLRVVAGKTASSARTLSLPTVLVTRLHAHWERQQEERRVQGVAWHEHGLVFPSAVGTPLSAHNLVRHFKAVLARGDLPGNIRFHDLRHSCATLLIAQDIHPRIVMEILGHSQISVTMDVYGHVAVETQRGAMM